MDQRSCHYEDVPELVAMQQNVKFAGKETTKVSPRSLARREDLPFWDPICVNESTQKINDGNGNPSMETPSRNFR